MSPSTDSSPVTQAVPGYTRVFFEAHVVLTLVLIGMLSLFLKTAEAQPEVWQILMDTWNQAVPAGTVTWKVLSWCYPFTTASVTAVTIAMGFIGAGIGFVIEWYLRSYLGWKSKSGLPGTAGKIAGPWAWEFYRVIGRRASIWPVWIDVGTRTRLAIVPRKVAATRADGRFVDTLPWIGLPPTYVLVIAFLISNIHWIVSTVFSFYLCAIFVKNVFVPVEK